MKKFMTTLILTFAFLTCIAPTRPPALCIVESEPVYIYNMDDPLLRSVAYSESRFLSGVVNKISGARGLLQITKPMIKEVNKILCKYGLEELKFTWKDAFDPEKSIAIWYIVQNYHNPEYGINEACKLWFGSGVQYDGMTWIDYSKLVKSRLSY